MSGLKRLHDALGAVYAEVRGVAVPWRYGNEAAEHAALRTGAGLVDQSERGVLALSGADRVDFLNGQCTANIKALTPGGVVEALFLNARGQVELFGTVYHRGEALWITAPSGMSQALEARFRRYIIFDQVALEPFEAAQFRLVGPKAGEVLGRAGYALPEAGRFVEVKGGLLARDAHGYALVVPVEDAEAAWRALCAAGATPVGRGALEVWRVERGIPDLPEALGRLPQEVGLEDLVHPGKGCYLGQEIMARLEARGNVRRRLMGLRLGEVVPSGAEVTHEGRAVGQVGTVVRSPRLGAVALAVLGKALEPGDRVEVGGVAAEVAALPFVD
ncbi:YgfZ/GcvT domain-containing protein [Marinithermus hydrothermalis]|uniref:Folate-binding protein YgfZ n=1 Tax=Marinithermus hydrothermalis (strain DSM 14884 / JCM 11576 / T1) TaxID=869210 RepID=F2NPY7_MARHT|nr:glycine cleavage T C-terminal barrel domain-containing protein [Marinithermus hydrothermalis]AEB11088.1 folate-binding protein YgfZ [Marinithermus hydrothermalis DSM 14884]